jgi:hypothetical protein
MDLLSKITGFLGGIPWVKVGVFTALVSGVLYGVHVIKLSGEQAEVIKEMQADAAQQKKQDAAAIQALKDQYKRDTEALQKEKTDAIEVTKETQQQLDKIKNSGPSADGPVSPVLSDTLSWMRAHTANNLNSNTKGKSAGRAVSPGP